MDNRCSFLLAFRKGKWRGWGGRGREGGGLCCSLICASIAQGCGPRAVLQQSEEQTWALGPFRALQRTARATSVSHMTSLSHGFKCR